MYVQGVDTIAFSDLKKLRCAECGDADPKCGGIVLASRCHPGKGADVRYVKGTNQLEIVCHACKAFIVKIQLPNESSPTSH